MPVSVSDHFNTCKYVAYNSDTFTPPGGTLGMVSWLWWEGNWQTLVKQNITTLTSCNFNLSPKIHLYHGFIIIISIHMFHI
jgi:hypothetical protein